MNRRRFLRTLALAGAGALLGPRAFAGDGRTRWRMALAWPKELALYTRGVFQFARQVSLLTESRLAVDVAVARPGTTPAEAVAMVRRGEVHCAHCFASALDGGPALDWFDAVPFGLGPLGTSAWLYHMDGLDLLKQAALPLGLYARPLGDAGPGPLGWARRPLDGPRALDGLRLTAHGQAARVLTLAGAAPRAEDEGDGTALLTALRDGSLDAASWHGPHHEAALGLPNAAPHGTGPAWHAPSRRMMLFVDRGAYEALPAIVRKIFDAVAEQADYALTASVAAANARALAGLAGAGRAVRPQDPALTARLAAHAAAVSAEAAAADPLAARVRASYETARGALGRLGALGGDFL